MSDSAKPTSRVFLSYARDDRGDAEEIARALGTRGVEVWLDSDAIAPGESFQKSISDAISQSSAVVVIISPKFLESSWCQFEIELALKQNRPLIPVLVHGDISDSPFKYLNHLDYRQLGGSESGSLEAAALIERSLEALTQPTEVSGPDKKSGGAKP